MDTVAIIGLGNPGTEYQETRHNVGFRVIGELSKRLRSPLKPGKGEYLLAHAYAGGSEIYLAAPTTYMNNSGIAVVDLLGRYHLTIREILVVADDFTLPLGRLRFRLKGSDGGHNGLASIIMTLNSDEFPRLRCGIGTESMPPKREMAEFVLSPFDRKELPAIEEMVQRAADAALEFARTGHARPANPKQT
jgi:peptidyl-tRNA hydrolase, PTH1 family